MRGRKPKPAHLKLVTGAAAGAGMGGTAPSIGSKAPTCPSHLGASAKAEWKRLCAILVDNGIVTEADRAALAAYCQAYGRWVEAEKKLAETPLLIKLPSGYIQQSTWLAVANKQLELMHRFMSEIGLSPVSRSRVAVTPRIPPPWEFD